MKNSPAYIQTSLAAAMSLGLEKGSFKDGIKLTGLNLLLVYGKGCIGKCAYCGLSKVQDAPHKSTPRAKTFIRVKWPVYKLDEVLGRTAEGKHAFQRVCLSMVTHRDAVRDTIAVTKRLKQHTDLPISLLISPSVIGNMGIIKDFKRAGAEMAGIAVDAATPALFQQYRGTGVGGPHQWEKYWEVLQWSLEVFGRYKAGIHLICGLGETEQEMVQTIARAHRMGARTHLFSFFPEAHSQLQDHPRPSLASYRRIQIAAYLINHQGLSVQAVDFDQQGNIAGFDYDLEEVVSQGYAFMTSGCPGKDQRMAACNRPLANERPSEDFRNYPYLPRSRDRETIREQIKSLWPAKL